MRKVKFMVTGTEYEGYFVGIAGLAQGMVENSLLVVEDLEGKIYTVLNDDVKFTGKPINMSPVKRIDLRLMRNAIDGVVASEGKPFTIQDLIDLAENRNVIIEETDEPNN